jgi:hypothetical protein
MSATASTGGNQPTSTASNAATLGTGTSAPVSATPAAAPKPAIAAHQLPTSPAHAGAINVLFDVANKLRTGAATANLSVSLNADGSYKWTGSGEVPDPKAP